MSDSTIIKTPRDETEISTVINEPAFPCIFARKASKVGAIRYFRWSVAQGDSALFEEFMQFTHLVKATEVSKRIYLPLIIVLTDEIDGGLAQQQAFAWQVLKTLYTLAPAASGPFNEPDFMDSRWVFEFNGVQLFFNISAPGHQLLRNRNLGEHICIVVNARDVFDVVAPGTTANGRNIRYLIRERVKKYNPTGMLPEELGFFGDPDSLEWKQYQLREPGGLDPQICPFSGGARHLDGVEADLLSEKLRETAVLICPSVQEFVKSAQVYKDVIVFEHWNDGLVLAERPHMVVAFDSERDHLVELAVARLNTVDAKLTLVSNERYSREIDGIAHALGLSTREPEQ